MVDSLWGDEFKVEDTKAKTKRVINKIATEKKVAEISAEKAVKSKKLNVDEKIRLVKDKVLSTLGKQIDNVVVLRTKEELHDYINKGLSFGRIAIDTETNNSLDPITCKLMGLCLYVKGEKQAYIPVNHVDKETKERLSNQCTEKDIEEELSYLIRNKGDCKFIFHNGKFDYEVLKCTCNVEVPIDWDTMIGAKLLDENENSAGLKWQYIDKIDSEQAKYDIENLFEKLPYDIIDPDLFALYAATDAMMTDRLYEWQMNKFKDPELKDVLNLALTLEMPLVKVFAWMELNGVEFDSDYQKLLSAKYHKIMNQVDSDIEEEIKKLQPQIDAWRLTEEANKKTITNAGKEGKSKNEQLTTPINLSSPTQLAILIYDVLKVKPVSTKTPRGTGSDILEKINLPFCNLLVKRKELEKLITGFIDALPEYTNVDGRIHCHFNQLGAATGRQSSSNPNLQQVPSHAKEIRMLFKASEDHILVGADYSQQEVRIFAAMTEDENMIQAYKDNKDIYALVASMVYHNNYEDNLEHYPDGSINIEGKDRRNKTKSLVLGLQYGRGIASIAEQIHGTVEEAQDITNRFFNAFPKAKKWMDKTQEDAKKLGYVTDLWGRRRRLPDILLPKYELKDLSENKDNNFNPFLNCEDRKVKNNKVEYYSDLLDKVRNRKEYEKIKELAVKDNIDIKDNSGFIAQAERQCVNSRIQGSAASMTKQAMLDIYNDKLLRQLGFKLLISVHDELIGECPLENREEVADRLSEVMKNAAATKCSVPFKCDAEISTCWYLPSYVAMVEEEFEEKLQSGMTDHDAFEKECEERTESRRDQIYEIVKKHMSYKPDDIIETKSIY